MNTRKEKRVRRDWDEEPVCDQPTPARRKRKRRSRTGPRVVLLLVILLVLVGVGLGGYFLFRHLVGGGEEAREQFLGQWEGVVPEDKSMVLRLVVDPDTIRVTGSRAQTGESRTDTLRWKVLKASPGKLLIELEASKNGFVPVWSVEFESEDRIVVRYDKSPDRPARTLTRVGKRVSRQERDETLVRNRAQVLGKWLLADLMDVRYRQAVLELNPDGSAKITYTSSQANGTDTVLTGTFQATKAKGQDLWLRFAGFEQEFNQMYIQIESADLIRYTASKTGIGIQRVARRLR